MERARIEIDEALDDLDPIADTAVCHAEGMLVGGTLGLEYATKLLEDLLKDQAQEPSFEGIIESKSEEVARRTGVDPEVAYSLLAEANYDVEAAVSAARREMT